MSYRIDGAQCHVVSPAVCLQLAVLQESKFKLGIMIRSEFPDLKIRSKLNQEMSMEHL